MSDVLNDKELKELARLGNAIKLDLDCDLDNDGVPCRSCRFEVVKNMKQYLKIHDVEVANG